MQAPFPRQGGNSVQMVKKHYAKSIPQSELDSFWQMTPAVVLAGWRGRHREMVDIFGSCW
jgi:hypothetical protein